MLFKLLRTELKLNLRCLPTLLAGFVLFGALFSLIALTLSRTLYKSETPVRATVAVVSTGDQEYLDTALRYISGLESASFALDFVEMKEEEAYSALEAESIIAIMLLPPDAINSILYGYNDPIRIVFSPKSSLTSVFLSELSRAGMRLLSAAQASTYTASRLFREADLGPELSAAYYEIDMLNFNHVLNREKLFVSEDTLPVFLSYLASGLVLLLAFAHICYAPALKRERSSFYSLLFASKASPVMYLGVKAAVCSLTYFCFLLLLLIAGPYLAGKTETADIVISPGAVALVFLSSFILACLALLLHQLFSDAAAVMAQIICALLMLFAGGGLIPAAFLPAGLLKAGSLLPAPLLWQEYLKLLTGEKYFDLLPLLLWGLAFFAAASGVFMLRRKELR